MFKNVAGIFGRLTSKINWQYNATESTYIDNITKHRYKEDAYYVFFKAVLLSPTQVHLNTIDVTLLILNTPVCSNLPK